MGSEKLRRDFFYTPTVESLATPSHWILFFLSLQLSTLQVDNDDIKHMIKVYVTKKNMINNSKYAFREKWLF